MRYDKDALDSVFFPGGVPSKVVKERRVEDKLNGRRVNGVNWDRNPKRVMLRGEEQEFFRTSALAQALGKSVKTIYAWEAKGILPRARYRSAAKRDSLAGKTAQGDRLYTRFQIEATVSAAQQCGILVGRSPDWRRFTALVKEAWAK
jgi:hypothetical protein